MSGDRLTLLQAFTRLRALGDRKPAYTIAQANLKGCCDLIGKDDSYYRITSHDGKYSIRKL